MCVGQILRVLNTMFDFIEFIYLLKILYLMSYYVYLGVVLFILRWIESWKYYCMEDYIVKGSFSIFKKSYDVYFVQVRDGEERYCY